MTNELRQAILNNPEECLKEIKRHFKENDITELRDKMIKGEFQILDRDDLMSMITKIDCENCKDITDIAYTNTMGLYIIAEWTNEESKLIKKIANEYESTGNTNMELISEYAKIYVYIMKSLYKYNKLVEVMLNLKGNLSDLTKEIANALDELWERKVLIDTMITVASMTNFANNETL